MKIGILGPVGGLLLAAVIIGLFVFNTVQDSPWRWLGVGLGVVVFIGSIALAIRGEKKTLNDKARK